MMRNMMNVQRHFAVGVIVVLCAWSSLADANDSSSTAYSQPFVVDIRMPGVRTFEVFWRSIPCG